jgi:hypothetical protein
MIDIIPMTQMQVDDIVAKNRRWLFDQIRKDINLGGNMRTEYENKMINMEGEREITNKYESIHFRVSPEMKDAIKQLAQMEWRKPSEYIRNLVIKELIRRGVYLSGIYPEVIDNQKPQE